MILFLVRSLPRGSFSFLLVSGCVGVVSWWSIWVVGCILGISMESRVVDRPWYHWLSTAGEPDTFSTWWGPILALNLRNRRVWLATDERFHWWCWWLVPCSCSCSCLVRLVCDSLDHWSSWPLVPWDTDCLVEILFLSSDSLGGTLQDGDRRLVLFNYPRPLICVVFFLLSLAPLLHPYMFFSSRLPFAICLTCIRKFTAPAWDVVNNVLVLVSQWSLCLEC